MSPRRTRLVVAIFVVIIGAVIGAVIGGVPATSKPDLVTVHAVVTTTVATTPSEPPTTQQQARPASEVKVKIVNASSVGGAAPKVGQRLAAKGYQVLPPGPSAKDKISQTLLLYADGRQAEAIALATSLGVVPSLVSPLTATSPYGDLGGADVLVVVADDTAKG
jgi:hypothetical protein